MLRIVRRDTRVSRLRSEEVWLRSEVGIPSSPENGVSSHGGSAPSLSELSRYAAALLLPS